MNSYVRASNQGDGNPLHSISITLLPVCQHMEHFYLQDVGKTNQLLPKFFDMLPTAEAMVAKIYQRNCGPTAGLLQTQ
jgi:hypothetical protein